jgi:hypothetical protein
MWTCFSAMAGFGPGWTTTAILLMAAASVTYLLTKRAGRASRVPGDE